MQEARTWVEANGLTDRVVFAGWVDGDEKLSALSRADIFVLPSHTEGLPNAMLEAMAAGLPVVASRVGGVPEIVHERVTGYLADPGDEGSMTESLARLIEHPDLRAEMGAAARRHVERHYSVDRLPEMLERLYRSVIAPQKENES